MNYSREQNEGRRERVFAEMREGSNMSGYDTVLQRMRERADDAESIAAMGEDYDVASAARRALPKLAADVRALITEIEALRAAR